MDQRKRRFRFPPHPDTQTKNPRLLVIVCAQALGALADDVDKLLKLLNLQGGRGVVGRGCMLSASRPSASTQTCRFTRCMPRSACFAAARAAESSRNLACE